MFDPFSQLSVDNGGSPTSSARFSSSTTEEDTVNIHFAGASAFCYQQMQISPDQGVSVLDVFNQAPPIMHQYQQKYQQFMNFPPTPQTNNGSNMMVVSDSRLSPAIPSLWSLNPAITSPMGCTYDAVHSINNNCTQLTSMPALPCDKSMVTSIQNPFDFFNVTAVPLLAASPAHDPFSSVVAPSIMQQSDDADFWNDMSFGLIQPTINANGADHSRSLVTPGNSVYSSSTASDDEENMFDDYRSHDVSPVALDERGLPAGGEYYNARVTTTLLGAIFSSGYELESTLFKHASNTFIDAIGKRPVASFIIDGSAADTAGIQLGHVLLSVNGVSVSTTDEAVRMITTAPRPMTMEFHIPNNEVKVLKTEAQCMVKYDDQSTEAPQNFTGWKPKYVVVGDVLGQPHILYMYRSKVEYDIAVKESQRGSRRLSVKVKQFDLRGARLLNEQGTVRYAYKPTWHYFTVVRGEKFPLKISSTNVEELQSVYEGIVTVLDKEARNGQSRMEQRRDYNMETYY